MGLIDKIGDAIREPVLEHVQAHPRTLTIATGALVILTCALFMSAMELDVHANDWRRARLGEIQLAASEALGG
jgi:hypothetical protein